MSNIRVICSNCQKSLKVSNRFVGKTGICPGCSHKFVIDLPASSSELDPEDDISTDWGPISFSMEDLSRMESNDNTQPPPKPPAIDQPASKTRFQQIFEFDSFIAPTFFRVNWAVGFVICSIWMMVGIISLLIALVGFLSQLATSDNHGVVFSVGIMLVLTNIFFNLVLPLIAMVFWRMTCEAGIVFFRIYEVLKDKS